MSNLVVNLRYKRYDVYIGRGGNSRQNFGNPFSHLTRGMGSIFVATREEAIQRFDSWLEGTSDVGLLPEKRQWILDHLPDLKGKVLGCFCTPLRCHGDVLVRRAHEIKHP